MSSDVITSQTAEDTSTVIALVDGQSAAIFTDLPLGPGETVELLRSHDGGSTFPVSEGLLLNSAKQTGVIYGPGDFAVKKSVTAIATAVKRD